MYTNIFLHKRQREQWKLGCKNHLFEEMNISNSNSIHIILNNVDSSVWKKGNRG